MFACNCKGIPEDRLRDLLAEAAGPVDHEKLHREIGGDDESCCGGCRNPEANRLFVDIVKAHNAQFEAPNP